MNRSILTFVLCFMGTAVSYAQSSTSPYTVFGIGSIDVENHGQYAGMGGLGIGIRQMNTLNSANPAALSGIQRQKFIMDVSVYGSGSLYSGQGRHSVSGTGNLERAGIGFRIGDFVCAGAGIVPLSMTEYRISKSSFVEGSDDKFTTYYTGSGGLHKASLSLAFNITENLSAGITGSVIMGTVTHHESSDYWSAARKATCNITPYFDFGIQYRHSAGNNSSVTAGITGGYKKKVSMRNIYEISAASDSSSVVDKVSPNTVQYIPAYIGGGISYTSRTITVGLDYTFQNWSSIDSGSDVVRYKNRSRLTAGLCWTPNRYDIRRYWKKISYLFGISADDSYLTVSGKSGLNWALSAGMSFPVRTSTSLYWSLRFKRYSYPVHTRNTITENMLTFTLGISFGESWFVRKKYE